MNKEIQQNPFYEGKLRPILKQITNDEISIGKGIELLNEIAIEWHQQHLELQTIANMDKICAESLSPVIFEKWEEIKDKLKLVRKNIK